MSDTSLVSALDYVRRLYADTLDWYKSADSKAQVLLTLDAAFLAFLTSLTFTKHGDLIETVKRFGTETWIFLILMVVSLSGSIVSALVCLWSRIYSRKSLERFLANLRIDEAKSYPPGVMHFFQTIDRLNRERFLEQLGSVSTEFEIHALGSEIVELSRNVLTKHRWVNRGFALAVFSLILLMAVGISYLARLQN